MHTTRCDEICNNTVKHIPITAKVRPNVTGIYWLQYETWKFFEHDCEISQMLKIFILTTLYSIPLVQETNEVRVKITYLWQNKQNYTYRSINISRRLVIRTGKHRYDTQNNAFNLSQHKKAQKSIRYNFLRRTCLVMQRTKILVIKGTRNMWNYH